MKKSTHVSWLALVGALAVAPLGASFAADSTTTDPTLTPPAATDTTTTAAPEQPKGADVPVVDVDTSTTPKSKGSLAQMVPGQMTVSDLMGKDVINANGDKIGEINDLVLDQDHVPYVVLSVGGFLGIGADYVAVPFDKIQIGRTGDGDSKVQIVASVTEDDLKNLAAAQRGEETTTSEAGRSVPPADTTAPAADTTAAPADTTAAAPADTTAAPADTAADATAPAATTPPADATTDTAATTAPAADTTADRTQVAAAYANVTAEDLIGKTVVNTAGDTIGEIDDLVIDDQKVVMAVVSVGGFLGIGEKHVAVPLEQLTLSEDKATLASGLTKDDLEKMPAYEKGKLHGIDRGQPIFGNS